MGKMLNMLVFTALVLGALLQSSGAQTIHQVGDDSAWNIPSGGSVAYSNWASRQTFTVGDVLVFNFTTGRHDVAEVTKTAFDSCNSNSPISISTTGPTNITLNSTGEHFFICTISGHCNAGQKLAINVSAAASTSPAPQPAAATPSPQAAATPAATPSTSNPPATSPATSPSATTPPPSTTATPPTTATSPTSPSPSGSTAPPPPGSSASPLTMAALPVTLLSIAVALLH